MWNCRSHTLLFENWTIRLDVGRKWDTLVPLPDPLSSTFWPCPLLNCLCSEEWLWASEDDLSLTQRSIRPIMKQHLINMRSLFTTKKGVFTRNGITETEDLLFMLWWEHEQQWTAFCLNISYETRFTWFHMDKSAEEIYWAVQLLTKEVFCRSRINSNIKVQLWGSVHNN